MAATRPARSPGSASAVVMRKEPWKARPKPTPAIAGAGKEGRCRRRHDRAERHCHAREQAQATSQQRHPGADAAQRRCRRGPGPAEQEDDQAAPQQVRRTRGLGCQRRPQRQIQAAEGPSRDDTGNGSGEGSPCLARYGDLRPQRGQDTGAPGPGFGHGQNGEDADGEDGQQGPPDEVGRCRGVLDKRAGDQRAQSQAQGGEDAGHQRRPLAARRLQVDQRGPDRPAGQAGRDALQGSGHI